MGGFGFLRGVGGVGDGRSYRNSRRQRQMVIGGVGDSGGTGDGGRRE